ncbi:Gfo/Idh/MocA family protein [Candidatus Spongiisocius sp.]|uniref:Gfo/Idh/MocA family protein n=1 Tax=Candidatus Spongiisocius sp. TaxID=3101273 RepID=UPI003B5BF687
MENGKRVRVGVIGAGSWAIANHIPILAAREDVEMVSAVRTNRKALALLRERFGFEHVSDDYRDALELGLDAVVVASPAGLHYEHVKAALEAGAHVLCEKPFTTEPEHAWTLHDIASERDRHLLLALGWNYRPTAIEAKRLMETPGVGDVQHILVAMASGLRGLLRGTGSYRGQDAFFQPAAKTWTDPRLSGGGYAPAALSHALGLALWLTGQRASQVFAFMNEEGAGVDLHDAISVRFSSGATGSISGASSPPGGSAVDQEDAPWPRHQLQVRVYGTEGHLVADLERDFLWLFRDDGEDVKVDLPPRAGLYGCEDPPDVLIDLALGNAAVNRSPAEVGARTVELLSAAYQSASTGAVARVRADGSEGRSGRPA